MRQAKETTEIGIQMVKNSDVVSLNIVEKSDEIHNMLDASYVMAESIGRHVEEVNQFIDEISSVIQGYRRNAEKILRP